MKHYPQTFEYVFSVDHPGNHSVDFHIEKVTSGDMELNTYINFYRNFLTGFYATLFSESVKFAWLRRKFTYSGEKTSPKMMNNSPRLCGSYMKFMRRIIGKDVQVITRSNFFQNLESWMETLFPGFVDGNPFENPDYYKFPFKNISIDYLSIVYQLDDGLELLKLADEQKMSWAVFADYVINHVKSINQEIGRERYLLRNNRTRHFLFHIEDSDKKHGKT